MSTNSPGVLPEECRRALEAWVCEDLTSVEAEDHLQRCWSCRELADAIRLDQELLRWQLGRIESPPPRHLQFREPLRSASGHPRRVSLALLPFLIGVVFVLLLAVELMIGTLSGGRAQLKLIDQTHDQIEKIQSAVEKHLPAPGGSPLIERWGETLRAADPKAFEGIPISPVGSLLDPFGAPYRLLAEDGSWRVYSTGPNCLDESVSENGTLDRGARGDDLYD